MGYNSKYNGSEVDNLLDKAGTAIQEHQDISHLAPKTALESLQAQFNALVGNNAKAAIESFNEIIAFLAGVEDDETLEGIIASIEQQIADKQERIDDLSTIRAGANAGATAVQPDDLAKVAKSGNYNDLSNKPTIPSAVTVDSSLSSTSTNPVQNKVVNSALSGKYSKPSSGIPKSDLASAVQDSLGLADKAITTDNLISIFKNFTQNLGIGVGGEYRLHVGSSAAVNGTLVLRDNSNALVLFQKADKTRMGYIGMRQADTPIFIKSNASTTCKLVHEGMTELNLNSKKVIDASGNPVFYGTVDSSSDKELKDIKGDVKLSVKQLAEAPAIIFTWKEGDDKQYVGTIAQYWKDVLPEVVSGDEGNLRMDYASLGVVNSIILARKVEEQDATIKELMNEIAELKSRL